VNPLPSRHQLLPPPPPPPFSIPLSESLTSNAPSPLPVLEPPSLPPLPEAFSHYVSLLHYLSLREREFIRNCSITGGPGRRPSAQAPHLGLFPLSSISERSLLSVNKAFVHDPLSSSCSPVSVKEASPLKEINECSVTIRSTSGSSSFLLMRYVGMMLLPDPRPLDKKIALDKDPQVRRRITDSNLSTCVEQVKRARSVFRSSAGGHESTAREVASLRCSAPASIACASPYAPPPHGRTPPPPPWSRSRP
jgi:hypothetical protein